MTDKWRSCFLKYLCSYIVTLKQRHSNLTFSIIYPMHIYSRRIKQSPAINKKNERMRLYGNGNDNYVLRGDEYVSNIWCYLRVSEGSIVTPDIEPIYESTHVNMRKDSEFSRITGISQGFSLQIEDQCVSNSMNHTYGNHSLDAHNNKKKQKPSKKGNVQTGKFPLLSKKLLT